MAKEQDQTQDKPEEDTTAADEAQAEETKATEAAVKTSEAFDKIADSDDIEETLPDEKDEKEEPAKKEDKADADDKDTGETKKESEQEEEQKAEEKDATDTGETKISKELAQKAIDLGLTEDEVQAFDNKDELQEQMDVLEAISAEEEVKKPDVKPDEETSKKEPEADESELKFENEADIDPGIVKFMKDMDKRHRDEVAGLKAEVNDLTEGIATENVKQFTSRFDAKIDELGLPWVDTFGRGKTMGFGRGSKAFKNRDAVRGRMLGFAKAMPDITDEQRLFDLALDSLHKEKLDKVTGSQMHKKTTARAKQRIGRAATNKTGTMTGDQKAVETSKKFDELIDTSED